MSDFFFEVGCERAGIPGSPACNYDIVQTIDEKIAFTELARGRTYLHKVAFRTHEVLEVWDSKKKIWIPTR